MKRNRDGADSFSLLGAGARGFEPRDAPAPLSPARKYVESARRWSADEHHALSPLSDFEIELAADRAVELRELRQDEHRIFGRSSTELHWDENGCNPELFSPEDLRFLAEERPLVVVVDGSVNRRFPDAFQGYRNYFGLLDRITGATIPSDAPAACPDVENAEAEAAISKKLGAFGPESAPGYAFYFHHLGSEALLARHRRHREYTPPALDFAQIRGPAVIAVQTALSDAELREDPAAQTLLDEDRAHEPAYFDDRPEFDPVLVANKHGWPKSRLPVHRVARQAFKVRPRPGA